MPYVHVYTAMTCYGRSFNLSLSSPIFFITTLLLFVVLTLFYFSSELASNTNILPSVNVVSEYSPLNESGLDGKSHVRDFVTRLTSLITVPELPYNWDNFWGNISDFDGNFTRNDDENKLSGNDGISEVSQSNANLINLRRHGLVIPEHHVLDQKGYLTEVGQPVPIDGTPVIILLTLFRFGSSVVGQLFNQNDKLFYLFEPLWATARLRQERHIQRFTAESQQLSRDILRGFARCKFDDDFVRAYNSWGGKTNNNAMCKAMSGCRLMSAGWLQGLCNKYQGRVATKLIRADLELLRPLVVEDGLNLKIVHLVRDPRGAAASRIHYKLVLSSKEAARVRYMFPKVGRLQALGLLNSTPETGGTVRGTCQWIRENAKLSSEQVPGWLQGRYHLVRFEDFAESPLQVTKEIYKFAGLSLPRKVLDWVDKNTHPTKKKKGIFDTKKDSKATAQHWLQDLSRMEIQQIERECKDVLEMMGYDTYMDIINSDR